MKGFFLVFCVLILRSEALSFSRVSNGKVASDANHACMVLVITPELVDTGNAVLGSGSIISRRHVLTGAHLVFGENNNYQINFFVLKSRRTFKSNFALVHENFNKEQYLNDIALIFLQGTDQFAIINVIRLSTVNAQTGVVGTITGYGFTSKQSKEASLQPMSASQTVTHNCVFKDYNATQTHFCALDPTTNGIVCPGDNGAGLYIKNSTTGENELIGVASRIVTACSEADYTAYTRISLFSAWINAITNF